MVPLDGETGGVRKKGKELRKTPRKAPRRLMEI